MSLQCYNTVKIIYNSLMRIYVSMPEFVNLYNVKPGDGMYIDPNDRVKIW